MKKNLMVSLLLSVSLVLAACSQQESVSEPTDVDVPIEQADTVPGGVSVPKEEGAPDTEELDVGAEVVPVEEPVSEETAEPQPEETELTAEQKEFMEFYGLEQFPDNMTPEDYEELRMLMYASQDTAEYLETVNSAESAPYYEEPYELPTRTHEETRTVITEIADNFKSGPNYAELEGAALEYLDVNLDTLRNNPESNDYLRHCMAEYKNGAMSKEEFTFMIESWIEIAGPYGGQTITVQ